MSKRLLTYVPKAKRNLSRKATPSEPEASSAQLTPSSPARPQFDARRRDRRLDAPTAIGDHRAPMLRSPSLVGLLFLLFTGFALSTGCSDGAAGGYGGASGGQSGKGGAAAKGGASGAAGSSSATGGANGGAPGTGGANGGASSWAVQTAARPGLVARTVARRAPAVRRRRHAGEWRCDWRAPRGQAAAGPGWELGPRGPGRRRRGWRRQCRRRWCGRQRQCRRWGGRRRQYRWQRGRRRWCGWRRGSRRRGKLVRTLQRAANRLLRVDRHLRPGRLPVRLHRGGPVRRREPLHDRRHLQRGRVHGGRRWSARRRTPPACTDATHLQTYDNPGVCNGGRCVCTPETVACGSGGCVSGACQTDPCANVTCSTPPSVCYDAAGTCSQGSCNYPTNQAACDDGNACTDSDTCTGGVCSGTPRLCNTPPADSCADASTAAVYDHVGTCAGGACSYAVHYVSCPTGCNAGACNSSGWTTMTSNTTQQLTSVWGTTATSVWAGRSRWDRRLLQRHPVASPTDADGPAERHAACQ